MESAFVLLALVFLGVILIFPIWIIAVLHQIKNSQERINSEFQEFMHIERLKRKETPEAPIPKETPKPASAPAPVPEKKTEHAMADKVVQPAVSTPAPVTCEKKIEAKPAEAKIPASIPPSVQAPETEEQKFIQKPWTPPLPRQASEFEKNAQDIIGKIWSWIVVGEEHRPKNVSFEYAAASVWLLRSAILIILTGIGFFLKYSIENNLIGPCGRIAVSITVGLAMIIGGIRLAGKKYHIIAQGLLGGGVATLYLSIFASYRIYKLIPDAKLSFALMILITVATAIIAIRLNSMLVAIFGIIGGFCTPVMLSTGTADFPGLFSYMLMLGIGVLAIARYKDWKMLNALSFIFTYGLYLASLDKFYKHEDFTVAITFISLFFLLFSAIPLLYNIVHKNKSNALTLLGMFLNAAIFFSTCFHLITDQFERKWVAAASLSLAAFYIIQILAFLNRRINDRNLLILLTGFASFFITVTIPLVLSDEWITTAWSIQAAIFLWMSCRMKSNFIRMLSYVLYFLAFAHLFMFDFQKNFIFVKNLDYANEMLTRFMTFGILVISMALGYRLMKKEKGESGIIVPENDTAEFIPQNAAAAMFATFGFGLLFIYLHFEFYHMSRVFYPPCQTPLLTLIWIASIALSAFAFRRTSKKLFLALSVVLCFGLLFKVFIFDMMFWRLSIDRFWFPVNSFPEESLMRGLNFLMIVGAFAFSFLVFGGKSRDTSKFFGVLSLAMLFIYLSLELNTLLNLKAPLFRAGGISILWGLFGFSFILGGIIKNIKGLRYAGLVLFTVVVLKVFLSDLSRLSQLSRIIAFLALGLVVLAGAFIYVRFKDFFNTDIQKKDLPGEKKN
ncbi:MAG: DUF2339 domain-containing protein [Victivallales bacterium]